MIYRVFPKSKSGEAVSIWKGRRKLRIWSFRGPLGNRGSGMEQLSPDALAGMAGLEPTISESKSGVLPLHYIPMELHETETGEAGLGSFSVGWDMGLEPTTPGTTIRCSAN